MKDRIINTALIVLAACILFLCATGCKVQPIATSDSTSFHMTIGDTAHAIKPDSSESKYLLKCFEENGQLKIKVMQLLSQKPGERIYIPISTIDTNNILTNKVYLPSDTIHVPVYRFYTSRIKSAVYVKVTNIVTGWQWVQIYAGRLLIAMALIYIGIKVLKRYTSLKLPI